MNVKLQNLTIKSEGKTLIDSLDLEVTDSLLFYGSCLTGKSHLMAVLTGLTSSEAGSVRVNNHLVKNVDDDQQLRFRKEIGIVFQKHTFLSNLTLFQNLKLALEYSLLELDEEEIEERVNQTLKKANMLEERDKRPCSLSVDQLKVASFLRGLIHHPDILFWDDPLNFSSDDYKDFVISEIERFKQRGGLLIAFSSNRQISKDLGIERLDLFQGNSFVKEAS